MRTSTLIPIAASFAAPYWPSLVRAQSFNLSPCSLSCVASEGGSGCADIFAPCFCGNAASLQQIAGCINKSCGSDELPNAATAMSGLCSAFATQTLALDPSAFVSAGNAAAASGSSQGGDDSPSPTRVATFALAPTTSLDVLVQTSVVTVGGTNPTAAVVVVVTTAGVPSAAVSISSVPAPTAVAACSDNDSMLVDPLNWVQYGVDGDFDEWWQANITQKDNTLSASQVLGKIFGNVNFLCGIGDGSTCVAPSCDDAEFYFKQGISLAESQLDSLIPDLATIFATPSPPQNPASAAVPWIEAAIGAVLGFVPVIGPLFDLTETSTAVIGGVGTAAGALANGGLDTLKDDNPHSTVLQDLRGIGVTIHDNFGNASTGLQNWSATLLDGQADSSGQSLLDYFKSGRFALGTQGAAPDTVSIGNFFFQQSLARLANLEWTRDDSSVYTFVMCANATNVPCTNVSRSVVGDRTCCLYGLDSNAHYADPPGFADLTSSRYSLPAANISAGALQSYLQGGFEYNATSGSYDGQDAINVAANPLAQPFLQGASAPGVFTLPVCDVVNSSWVANYQDNLLPCCCGANCSETQDFANAAGLNSSDAYLSACKNQYSAFNVQGAASASPMVQRWVWMVLGFGWMLWML